METTDHFCFLNSDMRTMVSLLIEGSDGLWDKLGVIVSQEPIEIELPELGMVPMELVLFQNMEPRLIPKSFLTYIH